MHSELRMHPRMPTELQAEIKLPDEHSVIVMIRNISLGGIMLEGDDRMHTAIQQQPSFPVEVDVHFQLENKSVCGRYRLIHTVRRRQDMFHMGFMSLMMDASSTALIKRLLEDYEATLGAGQAR